MGKLDPRHDHCGDSCRESTTRFFATERLRAAVYFLIPAISAFAANWLPLLLVLAACCELPGCILKPSKPTRSFAPFLAILCAFLLWAAASALWAIDPEQALKKAAAVTGIAICGLVVVAGLLSSSNRQRRTITTAAALGTAFLALQLLIEVATDGAFTRLFHGTSPDQIYDDIVRLKPGASVLAIFAWPAGVVLWHRFGPIASAVLIVGGAVAIYALSAHSALFALGLGGLVMVSCAASLTATRRFLTVLACVSILIAPLAFSAAKPGPWIKELPDSVQVTVYHRFLIWNFSAQAVGEHPIVGWGLHASRDVPGGSDQSDINADLEYDPPVFNTVTSYMPLHPHNNFLQVWLELALVGALLLATLMGMMLRRIASDMGDKASAAGQLAMFTAAFTVAGLSYGIWQSWWMALLWLAAAQSLSVVRRSSDGPEILKR